MLFMNAAYTYFTGWLDIFRYNVLAVVKSFSDTANSRQIAWPHVGDSHLMTVQNSSLV